MNQDPNIQSPDRQEPSEDHLHGGNWKTHRPLKRSQRGDLAYRMGAKTIAIRIAILTTFLFLLAAGFSVFLYLKLTQIESGYSDDLDKLSAQNGALVAEKDALLTELTNLRTEKASLTATLDATVKELDAVKAERDELLDNDTVISNLTKTVSDLKAQIAEKDEQIALLEAKLAEKPEYSLNDLAEKLDRLTTLLETGAPLMTVSVTKTDEFGLPYYEDEQVYPNLSLYLYDAQNGLSYTFETGKSYDIGELKLLLYALSLLRAADLETATAHGENAHALVYDLETLYTLKTEDVAFGSGILKNDKPGTRYTHLRLVEIMLSYCDVTAYQVLHDYYGDEPLRIFLSSVTGLSSSDVGAKFTAKDLLLILKAANAMIEQNRWGENLSMAMHGAVATYYSQVVGGSVMRQYSRTETGYHELGVRTEGEPIIMVFLSDVSEMTPEWNAYLYDLFAAIDAVSEVFRTERK